MNKYVRLEDIQKRISLFGMSGDSNISEFISKIWSELPIVEMPDVISLNNGKMNLPNDCSEAKVEGYYEGFQQLWDCFRNYTEMNQEERFKVVGYISFQELFDKLTPTWFVDKIKKFEEQKKAEEEIKIDDEIYSEMTNTKAVVTFVDSWERWQCLSDNGFFVIDDVQKKYWVKTGRHFDIEGILKAMRE